MAKHLTSPEISKAFLWKISDLPQEGQLWRIKASFQDVYKGIDKRKYCQVQLLIVDNVKLIIQPKHKILFAKRGQLNKILNELEESGVTEQVEGPTDWLSKADATQIRMNIDMTTPNTAIKKNRSIIPILEELRYELNGS